MGFVNINYASYSVSLHTYKAYYYFIIVMYYTLCCMINRLQCHVLKAVIKAALLFNPGIQLCHRELTDDDAISVFKVGYN